MLYTAECSIFVMKFVLIALYSVFVLYCFQANFNSKFTICYMLVVLEIKNALVKAYF